MQLFLKILGGMANSVDPDQTAPSGSGSVLLAVVGFWQKNVHNTG